MRDHFNELSLTLSERDGKRRHFIIDIRAYDGGVALRYRIPLQVELTKGVIVGETTEFNFAGNYVAHAVGEVEGPPLGPVLLTAVETVSPPMLLQAGRKSYVAIHEAGLLDYAPMRLTAVQRGNTDYALKVELDGSAAFETPFETPWRVLFIGDGPRHFMQSDLLLNLAPPSRIADESWIQPGKAIWDRRIRKLRHKGLTYWFNTETFTRLIDFAAQSNIAYLLMDSNWYGNQRDNRSNPLTPQPGIDIQQIFSHARQKGVKIFLYINDRAFDRHDMETVFATYHEWGAVGVKYGFMRGSGQTKVRKTLNAIHLAAKHRLMINFHDKPVHPSGLHRTYPNLVTIEFGHAQLDGIRSFRPGDFINTAMVHMLAGPIDMNNGFYALDTLQERATGGLDYTLPYPAVPATVAAENARILITDGALRVLPDAPWEYNRKADFFEFVRALPNARVDETRVLHAELNSKVTTARRFGSDWFVGTVANEKGGNLKSVLDFLKKDVRYDASLYEDASDAHFQTNKEAYQIRRLSGMVSAISDYDQLWEEFKLLKANNEQCATLYKPYGFVYRGPDYHGEYGLQYSVDHYRNILS